MLGWFAIVAILLATLAPTVSMALQADRDDLRVEICTAGGTMMMAMPDTTPGEAPTIAHLLEHCPCCAGHAGVAGPPMSVATVLAVPGLTDTPPRAFLEAPRTAHVWVTAQPRGPPARA
jgi:hypothetical protein